MSALVGTGQQPPPLELLPYDDDVLLARGPQDEARMALTFFVLQERDDPGVGPPRALI